MNCPEVRTALPGFIYQELPPEVRVELQQHLDGCLACQREEAGLRQVRRLLAAAPEVRVDTAVVYRQAAERQARRFRRWRSLAVAACAAAVLVAVGVGLSRLEIRVSGSEMVLRWGAPPVAPIPVPSPSPPRADSPGSPPAAMEERIAAMENRLRVLSELSQALADDDRSRDYQHSQEIAHLREQLREWQGLSAERLSAMQKDFDALYVASFPDRKGVLP
ncbi:MAG TPA: zf-HC2 domain-containing protein [Gemmataceae bacterium]|nr:zf-HC2 domain-containing protein [Gemmataceae bacterium]